MATAGERRTGSTGSLTRTMKWIRAAIVIVALVALGIFLFKLGLDPANAGKPSPH